MDGFGFCSPNFVAVEYFEFVCHELWCGDNINDIVAAVGNVAIDAEIVCFNDGHAKMQPEMARIQNCMQMTKRVCKWNDAFVPDAQNITYVWMLAYVDSDSYFLCVVQGIVDICSNAQCTFLVDI